MAKTPAQVALQTSYNANGSATYTSANNTHKIIAGVNYPIEVPYRQNELPETTAIEVNLRPHNGVGMVKERHVESLIQQTLKTVVLGEETPRTMLQVTLQVVGMESDESLPGGVKEGGQGETYLDILVGAINTAMLACLDAAVQMKQIAGAALVGIDNDGILIDNPSVVQRKTCRSLHAFAFTRKREVILMESEGSFELAEWEAAYDLAERLIVGAVRIANGNVEMNGSDASLPCLLDVMTQAIETRVARDERWRQEAES